LWQYLNQALHAAKFALFDFEYIAARFVDNESEKQAILPV